MQQDPWAEFRTGPAPQQPAPTQRAPGVIQGPPSATSPAEQQRLAIEAELLRIAQQKAVQDQTEFEQAQAKREIGAPRDMDDVREELENVIRKAGTARRLSNEWFATGAGAETAGNFSGTNARDVQVLLDTIGGNIAFDRLTRMRAESPTGGALGNVTERELQLLQSTIAGLDKTQSDEQFRTAMDDVIRAYGRVLGKLPDTDANAVLQSFLERGSSKEELLALADGLGLSVDEAALDENLRSRDQGGPTGAFFTPEPPSGGGGGGGQASNVMFEGIPLLEGDYSAASLSKGFAQGYGDMVQGMSDAVGLFTDPFAGLIASSLGYDASQMKSLGTVNREALQLPQSPEGAGRTSREFASGALALGGLAGAVAPAAAPGTAQNVLSFLGASPIRDTAAGATAGAGAYYGNELGGIPGQIAGTLLGGITGFKAANALTPRPAGSKEVAQAAARQNVDVLPADVGGPLLRGITAGTRASPLSLAPVARAAEGQQRQFAEAARTTAARQGEVVGNEQAGELVRQGAQEFIKRTQARGNRLYERAARQAEGVRAIFPRQTVEAARSALRRLGENPAATQSDRQALEAFIQNVEGGVSIQGLRDARTLLSDSVYDGNLRSNTDQAMWKGILSSVADDIENGLRAAGRTEAAKTFRLADRLWSERIQVIDNVLQPIIGREGQKGGEQILDTIESMARGRTGGNARLSGVLAALPKEQANNVRATIIDRLGRATPGRQDATGDVYSASTFLTNWNRLTPQAKASLFPDSKIRGDLNDLATIAEGTRRSQELANTSNTGIALGANALIGGAGVTTNLPLTLLGAGSVYLTGRLMASPRFARLLVRTSRMPPEAANRTFLQQVGLLAAREPQLRNDLEALTNAINDNGRLAAENQQQE